MTGKTGEFSKLQLKPEDLSAFLYWLAPESTVKGEAYEAARRRLVIFFAGRKCLDPEALADQTIDCAIGKLTEIPREAKPLAYLIGIAKNIYRDYLRTVQKAAAAHTQQTLTNVQLTDEIERRHACLEKCLETLPPADRTLVLSYYSQSKQHKIDLRKQLADQFELSQNALRNRIFRLNQRLILCVTACLEHSPA